LKTFVDELKNYLQSTSISIIKEVWDKSIKSDEIGPSFEEFLNNHQLIYCSEPKNDNLKIKNQKFGLEYTSGFFI